MGGCIEELEYILHAKTVVLELVSAQRGLGEIALRVLELIGMH